MNETCDEVCVYQAVQEAKHPGGSSAVETWDSFLVTACTVKQLLLCPCPKVPAALRVLEQCLLPGAADRQLESALWFCSGCMTALW